MKQSLKLPSAHPQVRQNEMEEETRSYILTYPTASQMSGNYTMYEQGPRALNMQISNEGSARYYWILHYESSLEQVTR